MPPRPRAAIAPPKWWHEQHRAPAVEVDELERVLDRALDEEPDAVDRTRVVDDEADLEAGGERGQVVEERRAGQVDGRGAHLDAGAGTDLVGERLERPGVARQERDVDAVPGDPAGEGRADALGRAGDQGPRPVGVGEGGPVAGGGHDVHSGRRQGGMHD